MRDTDQDESEKGPRLTARGAEAKAEREQRQAEAMRANLRRRKQQARDRAKPPETPSSDAG
jgi:hypothetical protein